MIGAVLIAAVVLPLFLRWPKQTVMAGIPFFILQDALVAVLGGRDSALGAVIQNVDEVGLATLVAATVGVLVVTRRTPRLRPWVGWIAVYLVAGMLSMAGSGATATALGMFLITKGFAYAFVVDQIEWSAADARRWVKTLVVSVLVVAAFAVPDFIAPVPFRQAMGFDPAVDYRAGLPSVESLAGHPGGYGWLMAVGSMVAIAGLLTGRERRWSVLLVLCLFASALSLRRKPVLGILAAVVFVLPAMRRELNRDLIVRAVAALIVIGVPIALLLGPIIAQGARGYVSTEALTTQARTALYAGAALLARDHFPFGAGVGTYGSYGSIANYSRIYYEFGFNAIYGMSPTYPNFIQDTFWPQIIGETGLVGFVGYAGALLAIISGAWKRLRQPMDRHTKVLMLAATMIGIELVLESGAAPTYSTASQACLSLGLLAVAAGLPTAGDPLPNDPPNANA